MKNIIRIVTIAALAVSATVAFGQKNHARIPASRAERVALAKYHGKLAGKTELENEDGKWQYAVMVKSGHKLREVMVDAKTGRIANVEVVTPQEEAREKAAEAKHKKHKD